jgi:hypothetical protein
VIYDSIIVGDGLAGLSLGVLLARRQRRVLVMRGPWGPAVPPMPLPFPTGPLDRLFGRLQLRDTLGKVEVESHLTSVLLAADPRSPGGAHPYQLDLTTERGRLVGELTRCFGPDAARAAQTFLDGVIAQGTADAELFESLPDFFPTGLFQKRLGSRDLKKAFEGVDATPGGLTRRNAPPWARALTAPLWWLSPAPEFLPTWVARAYIALALHGFGDVDRFPGLIRKGLTERLVQGRGRLVEERAIAPALDGAKLTGALWADGEHSFPGRSLVWAAPAHSFVSALPDKLKKKEISGAVDARNPAFLRVHDRVLLRARVMPVWFAGRVLIEGGPAGAPLLVRAERGEDDRGLPGESVVLALTYRLPKLESDSDWALSQAVAQGREAAWRALRRAVPFCDEGVVRGAFQGDPTILPVYAPISPDAANDSATEQLAVTGLAGLPPRTAVEGAYLFTPDVFPALGPLGDLLLASRIADLAEEPLGAPPESPRRRG